VIACRDNVINAGVVGTSLPALIVVVITIKKKELPEKHKNAFHAVSRELFERTIAELDAKLDTPQTDEIIVGLQQIVALIAQTVDR
jgi:hypothetical protein